MLTFDSEKHAYFFNGQPTPSVTQALKLGGLIDDQWFDDASRDRGIAVHEAVLYDIQDDLDYDSLHPIVKGYLNGFLELKKRTRFKPLIELCEKRQYHPLYKYCGTPDIPCFLNGRPALLDVKTGDSKTARYQTAAYAEFPEIKVYTPDRYDLRLFPDGKVKLTHHADAGDFNVFLSCLNIAKIKLK